MELYYSLAGIKKTGTYLTKEVKEKIINNFCGITIQNVLSVAICYIHERRPRVAAVKESSEMVNTALRLPLEIREKYKELQRIYTPQAISQMVDDFIENFSIKSLTKDKEDNRIIVELERRV